MLMSTDSGSGEPALIFLHHFGGSAREWTEVVAELCRQQRCITVDTAGFGKAKEEAGYSVREMVENLTAVIKNCGLRRYILVGHSMTGKVSLALTASHPDGLEGLVLVTPSPPSPEPIEDQARQEMLARDGSRSGAEAMINKITAQPLPPHLLQRATDDHMRSSPTAWEAWLTSGSYEDWSEQVGTLDYPTLILTGEKDPALPAAVQRELTLPHLPNAQLEEIVNCGHLPPMEAAAEVVRSIQKFIAELFPAPEKSSAKTA